MAYKQNVPEAAFLSLEWVVTLEFDLKLKIVAGVRFVNFKFEFELRLHS
jgi:hypothetical protein